MTRYTKRQLELNGGQTMRQAIIYPGEDSYWVAECPTLPGCISQGKTRQEAIQNIREAINAHIATLKEDGLPVPDERFELLSVVVRRDEPFAQVVVPDHDVLDRGTLRAIIRQTDLSVNEFVNLLK